VKKISLGIALVMLIGLTVDTQAKTLKLWTKKTTAWHDKNGYVYAVGKAKYNHQSAEDFMISQGKATEETINSLKSFLKVDELTDFQIIDFDYSTNKYYVLAAVPKSKNTPKARTTNQHQVIQLSQDIIPDNCIKKFSQTKEIFACEINQRAYLFAVTTAVITQPGQPGIDMAYTIAKNKAKHNLAEHFSEKFSSSGEIKSFNGVTLEIFSDSIRFIGCAPIDENYNEFWGYLFLNTTLG
jgi:hypothetical protein